MRLRLDLTPDAVDALVRAARAERRPPVWHAEILLRRALGLPDVPPVPPAVVRLTPRRGGRG